MSEKSALGILSIFALALSMQACTSTPDSTKGGAASSEIVLDTYEKRISYRAAYDFHRQVVGNELPLDMDAFQAGITEAFAGQDSRISADQARADMQQFADDLAAAPSNYEFGRVNAQEQSDYLNENILVDGTATTQSGLQYRVLRLGQGNIPTAADKVRVRYRGTYIDGTVFEESDPEAEPVEFSPDGLIEGFREAVLMMREGAVWQVSVPPWLGYGSLGSTQVSRKAVLLFEIELVEIVPADDESRPAAGNADTGA